MQEIADITGDSLGLSQEAAKTTADVIVFCGVHFMAESAAILSPGEDRPAAARGRGVPDGGHDHRGPTSRAYREAHPGAVVVTYVNSSAEVKALSDVCCTSGNAVNVVKSIPAGKEIFMVPDRNLAQWVAKMSGRPLTWWDGYCPTHERLTVDATVKAKEATPTPCSWSIPSARPRWWRWRTRSSPRRDVRLVPALPGEGVHRRHGDGDPLPPPEGEPGKRFHIASRASCART